ncbi:MAG: hypothetical protein AAF790_02555 [Planctomycetota bacterium]
MILNPSTKPSVAEGAASAFAGPLLAAVRTAFRRSPAGRVAPAVDRGEGLLAWSRRLLPEHFRKPPSAMHAWLAAELDFCTARRGSKINLIGPRGSAKSTIATLAYVLRCVVEQAEPYVWIVSDTKHQAQTHLQNIAVELTDNAHLAAAYPQAAGQGPRWRASHLQLNSGAVIEAFGAGQRVRGRRRRADRPTLIVCDDLQNDRQTASASQRQAADDWFHGTLLKAGKRGTNIVNLATALHRDALAMRLHRTPGWRSRLFKAAPAMPSDKARWLQWEEIYCDAARTDPAGDARRFYEQNREAMDAGAEVLWPAEADLYTLMQMRLESGAAAFDREMQGSPIDPARCEWPESYFGDHVWFDDWPKTLTLRTLALDPSKGADARQGDYSALVMLGVDPAGVLYVDADLARRPTPQMVAEGVSRYLQFRPDVFGVEANQWQNLLATEFAAEFRRRGVLGAPLCEVHNYTNKQVRIRRLGPYLSQRRLRIRRASPSAQLLLDQLRDFPLGAHDDGPDALEMALRMAEEVWQGRRRTDGLGDRLIG